jgi:O-antigen/teichoic acid export membrane protein
MTGNQSFLFKISGIVLCIDIIISVIMIPSLGLTGAAIGTSISLGILYIVALIWAKKKLGLWPFDRRYYKGLFSGAATVLGIFVIKAALPETRGIGIITQGIAAIIIFSLSLIIQKLDFEDFEFVNMIKKYLVKGT